MRLLAACAAFSAYAIPASMLSKARSVPRILDITINTQNLPRFIDIVALRKK